MSASDRRRSATSVQPARPLPELPKAANAYRTIKTKPIELPQVTTPGDSRGRRASGRELGNALKPVIEDAVLDTLKENPKVIIEIVYPVLGRAIRKSIAAALQSLVATIENQAASVFSVERLKWRWQAITSGRSYAEIVLANSVLFSVDEVLLIHRETGLLLVHASRDPEKARDADLVSSMLTAIEDFARDSFDLDDEDSLSSFTMGGQTVLIRTSPLLVIAAAVEGSPTAKVTNQLDEVMERIHRDHYPQLEAFSGEVAPFVPLLPMLEGCLTRETGGASA